MELINRCSLIQLFVRGLAFLQVLFIKCYSRTTKDSVWQSEKTSISVSDTFLTKVVPDVVISYFRLRCMNKKTKRHFSSFETRRRFIRGLKRNNGVSIILLFPLESFRYSITPVHTKSLFRQKNLLIPLFSWLPSEPIRGIWVILILK